MAEKKLFTVTDLGGGNGGKGSVVHKICCVKNAHTVVKTGGAQGSHGVWTSRGESFNFSQFGCGTFEGAQTYISDLFVMNPDGIITEGEWLKYNFGIKNIFEYMTIDENAICTTPWHQIASRLHELARKNMPRGTIGTGVGEAFRDSEILPHLTIRAKDTNAPDLHKRLTLIRERKLQDLNALTDIGIFLEADRSCAQELIALLLDPGLVDWSFDRFRSMASLVKIVDGDHLRKNILSRDGTVVVESSHGVLTDRYYGFHPHTSKLRTIPDGTWDMIKECGYDGDIIKLGVTRSYQIRHGAGPMVTERSGLAEKLLPGSSKEENRWQGKARIGPLDFVALRYAVNVCGGPEAFDGIAVTWFDQALLFGKWDTCDRYLEADDPNLFTTSKNIKVCRGSGQTQLDRQSKLCKALYRCNPVITSYDLTQFIDQAQVIELCTDVFQEKLGLPVRMISLGASENEKICL